MCKLASRTFRSDPSTLFQLVAEVEFWPAMLPHIQLVRTLRRYGSRKVVQILALGRGRRVARWIAVEAIVPEQRRVRFRHVGGFERGRQEEWLIGAAGGRVDVRVCGGSAARVGQPDWPGARPSWWASGADLFLALTLDRLAQLAEGGSLAASETVALADATRRTTWTEDRECL